MTNEVIKAMQGKKEHKIRKWWHKNGYKIWRVVLFPVRLGIQAWNKINSHLNAKQKWSEKRATEILNYYIPRRAEWDEEDQCFYFFDNGMGWNIKLAKRYLKLKDRRFWKVNCAWWGSKMRKFLMNKFELEGFTKELGNCSNGWTDVTFILNKKG